MTKITLTTPEIIQIISYYPPHLGGMENSAAQIVEGLESKEYAVSVYTSSIGYSRKLVNNSKSQIHYLKSIEFAHTPIIFTLFFRLLALPRHSLIHLHIAQAFSPEVVYLISRLRKLPYIAHVHADVDASGSFGFLLGLYKKLFLKRVLKAAAKIICLTEPQKKLIASKYGLPLETIVVVPNGVSEKYFIGEKTRENTVPHLLFVGRLAVVKNLSLLIEAVSQMQASVFLDIVGEGELRKDIETLIQKYGLQNVKLHGRKTGKELIEFYRSADVFVLPSLKEGFPLSVLEALAVGLPVVVSDSPEMRQILGECGVFIQDPTAANYAKTLDALLSNKDTIQKLSALSIQKARSYSWENVLNSIEDVYQQVTSSDTPISRGNLQQR
jgi:glycosyltransferase involved in cell wall biosynthesis